MQCTQAAEQFIFNDSQSSDNEHLSSPNFKSVHSTNSKSVHSTPEFERNPFMLMPLSMWSFGEKSSHGLRTGIMQVLIN